MGVPRRKKRNQPVSQNGHKERISTTLDSGTKRALDAHCQERGEVRSDVVAEAVKRYLAQELDSDRERVTRLDALEGKLDRQAERLAKMASENQMLGGMALEALYHQTPSIEKEVGPEELRRRAVNRRRK